MMPQMALSKQRIKCSCRTEFATGATVGFNVGKAVLRDYIFMFE